MKQTVPIGITGLGCLSTLGHTPQAHLDALDSPPAPFRQLGSLTGVPGPLADVFAAWIDPRSLLCHRKWSPATCATLHVARQAVAAAGWSARDCDEAAIIFGTSRGTAAGWLEPWPDRRPFPIMAASNSLASEPAAAVSHELGIHGDWHVVSNGCCAGLDALTTAAIWLRAGIVRKVLVLACDLPLVRPVLDAYHSTGILATPGKPGMIPAEGAAAICLESDAPPRAPRLVTHASIAEPNATLGSTSELPALRKLLSRVLDAQGAPTLCIPHSSGTPMHALSENQILDDLLSSDSVRLPLKHHTGHCIGASGLLETVMACAALKRGSPLQGTDLPAGSTILKIASAMGGKHTVALIQSPHV